MQQIDKQFFLQTRNGIQIYVKCENISGHSGIKLHRNYVIFFECLINFSKLRSGHLLVRGLQKLKRILKHKINKK